MQVSMLNRLLYFVPSWGTLKDLVQYRYYEEQECTARESIRFQTQGWMGRWNCWACAFIKQLEHRRCWHRHLQWGTRLTILFDNIIGIQRLEHGRCWYRHIQWDLRRTTVEKEFEQKSLGAWAFGIDFVVVSMVIIEGSFSLHIRRK